MSTTTDGIGALGASAGLVTGNPALMIGGSLLGMFGGGGNEKSSAEVLNDSITSILNKALTQAINSSTQYTEKGVNTQREFLQNAVNSITGYGQAAQTGATNALSGGLNTYQTLQRPAAQAGYDALDAYRTSLGMNNIQGGSAKYVAGQQEAQGIAGQLPSLLKNLNNNYNQREVTPVDKTSIMNAITQDEINKYYQQNSRLNWNDGQGSWNFTGAGLNMNAGSKGWTGGEQAQQNEAIRNYLTEQKFGDATNAYNQATTANQNLSQLNGLLTNATNNPELMKQLVPLLRGKI